MYIRYGVWISGTKMYSIHTSSHQSLTGIFYSPMDYYFTSCSFDRTAKVWITEQVQPVRILSGHSSDVNVSIRTNMSIVFPKIITNIKSVLKIVFESVQQKHLNV